MVAEQMASAKGNINFIAICEGNINSAAYASMIKLYSSNEAGWYCYPHILKKYSREHSSQSTILISTKAQETSFNTIAITLACESLDPSNWHDPSRRAQ